MAAAGELGYRGLDREHRAFDVRGEDRVDVLLGHLLETNVGEDPGVGAQDVEAAEALHRLGHHALRISADGDVGADERHVPPGALQVGDSSGAGLGIAADDGDARARTEEGPSDALADALASTGHQDGPASHGGEHDAASSNETSGL